MNTTKRSASWLTVARREIMVQLTDKAFWIGTLTTLAIIAISFAASSFFAGGDGSPTRVAVGTDEAAAVVAQAARSGSNVEAVRVGPDDLSRTVEDGEAEAALAFVDGTGWQLQVENLADTPDLADAVRDYQIGRNAEALQVDPAQILADTSLTTVPLNGDEAGSLAILIATIAFSALFMLSAMTYGMQIAQSVVTEKESRIVEILAAAVPIRELLIGKVVGNTIMALGQVVLIVCVALLGLSFSDFSPMIAMIAPVAGWFVLFFLVGFASLACLWAAAGAMATRVQDLGQTTTPLTMIVMLVYMAGFFAKGTVAAVLSYIPVASTVLMPGRLLSGEAGWVDALLSLLVAVVFMAVTLWLGERIYRRGLLQTNSVLSIREAFRRAS